MKDIVSWSFTIPLGDENSINYIQQKFKIKMPIELIEIIKKYNGGYPSKYKCNIEGFGDTDLKCLLSFNEEDDETIYDVLEFFINKFDGMLIPFASDSSSGYYCISKNGVEYYNELDSNCFFVANNINEFLEKLKK